MADKTFYVQKFKQVFEEKYNQQLTDELSMEYFEILSAYYTIALKYLSPIDKEE